MNALFLLLSTYVCITYALDIKSKSVLAIWNVDCGGGLACNNKNPICCPNPTDSPFCVEGGQYCCLGSETGCPLGTTCCPSGNPKSGATCCNSTSTCETKPTPQNPDGDGPECRYDPCRDNTNKDTCLKSHKCGWCCDTNTCQTDVSLCPGTQWLRPHTNYTTECPDPCNAITDCDKCRSSHTPSGAQCGWCCSAGLCETQLGGVSTKATGRGCSVMSWIPHDSVGAHSKLKCSQCTSSHGTGLYHTQSLLMLIMFCILLPAMCICVVVVLFFKRCCTRLTRRDFLDNTSESSEPLLEPPSSATHKKVLKYGFDEDRKSDVSSEGRGSPAESLDEASTCALCMARRADIVFLPCYHCYCCSYCSTALEKTKKREGLICPFCRQNIDAMVNLAKVYKLNPAQRPVAAAGASSSSSDSDDENEEKNEKGKQHEDETPLPNTTTTSSPAPSPSPSPRATTGAEDEGEKERNRQISLTNFGSAPSSPTPSSPKSSPRGEDAPRRSPRYIRDRVAVENEPNNSATEE
eukprot:TRINITY_DN67960_c3_g1_i1.p1 TRINITY_DN67960_c3_g1~~TRINITY_DN67960_c3_g1_i1.p1  ORF type:complete len:522 (+),score=47.76 TRINITY_DN67960_c3_g1_i1:61-1626(+)